MDITHHLEVLEKKSWNPDQKEIVSNLINSIKQYKKFIPRAVNGDILKALQLCLDIKSQLEHYQSPQTCVRPRSHSCPPNISDEIVKQEIKESKETKKVDKSNGSLRKKLAFIF